MSLLIALAYLVAFVVNLLPVFISPTFSILAMFLIQEYLPLSPLAIGGALVSGLGRLGLALPTRNWGSNLRLPRPPGQPSPAWRMAGSETPPAHCARGGPLLARADPDQ